MPNTCDRSKISGYRIVDIAFVLHWALALQPDHSRICTSGKLYLYNETREGLVSKLEFQCTMCSKSIIKSTEELPPNKCSQLNNGVVWGTITSGSTYTSTKELLSVMDIPMMCNKTFTAKEVELGQIWMESLASEMIEAGKEEYAIAEKQHNVVDGFGEITVYIDRGWSKRSYGHNYIASSGVVCNLCLHIFCCIWIRKLHYNNRP